MWGIGGILDLDGWAVCGDIRSLQVGRLEIMCGGEEFPEEFFICWWWTLDLRCDGMR